MKLIFVRHGKDDKYLMLICKYQWRYLFVYKEEEESDYISTRNRNLERGLT